MNIIDKLQDKDNRAAYKLLLELESKSADSNELYPYFDEFLKLLCSESSYVRTRGFRMCCSQAKWDKDCRIERNIDNMLVMLDDEKPTAVRQSIAALHQVLLYKPELYERIKNKVDSLCLDKYKESIIPLIKKDIDKIGEVNETLTVNRKIVNDLGDILNKFKM